jgi:F-type H+-transporting ATPase subunit b
MSDILRQLGQLFVRSFPTVIFVFFLLLVLERLFFRPLMDILKKREEATKGALEKAREQAVATEAKAREYEEAFQAARQDVYRLREAARRDALAERESQLAKARETAESQLKAALDSLAAEVESARRELGQASQPLATEITDTVLGGGPSAGGQEGART